MIMPAASFLRGLPALFSVVSSALLLVGCSQMGTYQDSSAPDSAKLRFVASTDNATIDYYDAEHCDGQTTGVLNNLFIANSQRRVGMSVAAPEKARGYLEIKLPPEQDVHLRIHTQTGYATCGSGFTLKPERGAEYEVSFSLVGRQCSIMLQRLQRVDGEDVRTPLLIKPGSLPACYGRNPIFPQPPVALADTPERTALIERLVSRSLIVVMTAKTINDNPVAFPPEKLDSLISERKAKLGFAMPDDYWALYRQNLVTFDQAVGSHTARALQRANDEYRQRLRSVDDKQLQAWAGTDAASDKRSTAALIEREQAMIPFFFQAKKEVLAETVDQHLARMAQMDAQYDVCSRFAKCWRH
jgi:hypothetical protein